MGKPEEAGEHQRADRHDRQDDLQDWRDSSRHRRIVPSVGSATLTTVSTPWWAVVIFILLIVIGAAATYWYAFRVSTRRQLIIPIANSILVGLLLGAAAIFGVTLMVQ